MLRGPAPAARAVAARRWSPTGRSGTGPRPPFLPAPGPGRARRARAPRCAVAWFARTVSRRSFRARQQSGSASQAFVGIQGMDRSVHGGIQHLLFGSLVDRELFDDAPLEGNQNPPPEIAHLG